MQLPLTATSLSEVTMSDKVSVSVVPASMPTAPARPLATPTVVLVELAVVNVAVSVLDSASPEPLVFLFVCECFRVWREYVAAVIACAAAAAAAQKPRPPRALAPRSSYSPCRLAMPTDRPAEKASPVPAEAAVAIALAAESMSPRQFIRSTIETARPDADRCFAGSAVHDAGHSPMLFR